MARRPHSGARELVGRTAELDTIARACAVARDGESRLIVVRGPAGIGKSALCARAAARAERDGMTIGWGRPWGGRGSPPLWPWPDVLSTLGGTCAPPREDDQFARFAAIADHLAELVAARPAMIVLDDADALDAEALLLARFLSGISEHPGVVLVVVRRTGCAPLDHDVEDLLERLERDATIIDLAPLDLDDTVRFLETHDVVVDANLAMTLHTVTAGRPLALNRVVRQAGGEDGVLVVERAVRDALRTLRSDVRRTLAMAALLGIEVASADVAAVAGCDDGQVNEAMAAAADARLVRPGPNGWVFAHDLVRRTIIAALTLGEQQDAHALAATLMSGDRRVGAAAWRAHHALAAATRSDADAAIAVGICQRAARALFDEWAYDEAAALLGSVVALAGRLWAPAGHVDVLLDWADALQACGRLAEARTVYDRAVDAARAAADPLAVARAVLGLGGVWVNEDRGQAERARLLGLARAALEGLPNDEAGLRARLQCRLTAEAVYDGADVGPVFDALEAARRVGDPRVLAEALSLTHHALLAPEHLLARTPIAEELIGVAAAAGDGLRALFGLMWNAVNLVHAGDVGAERALNDVRERADAVHCRAISYIVAAIDVMRFVRAGRLDEAEQAAAECFQLGCEVGDADATGYYSAQLLTIRWLQDRDTELLDAARDIASSSTLIAPEFAFRTAAAAIAARAGHLDEARVALRQLAADGLAALPRSSSWMIGMVTIVEAARAIGDGDLANEAAAQLEPYAHRPAVASLGVSCFGSVERSIGVAALSSGDIDVAVERLTRAVDHNLALGSRPFAAIARADLAEALATRDGPGDRGRAIEAWRLAADAAAGFGMPARAERWARLADDLAGCSAGEATAVLRRDGSSWIIDAGDGPLRAPGLIGFSYLGGLLARPGEEIAAVDLCGGVELECSWYDVIDRTTVDSYRRRVIEIDEQLERARRRGRPDRIRALEDERAGLRRQLSSVLVPSGRSRRFVDAGERARTAVRKAIARAIDAIGSVDDTLASELRSTITTGRRCVYLPDPERPRRWAVLLET